LRLLGVISYSVYMWQQPLYLSSDRFPWHTGVLCALLIGCASFYLYESPIRRWLNAHWAERTQPEQPASKERASGPQPTVDSGETTPTLAARRMR
jgi:peptidoglycan/LPS O-acetylase OafA/YrhL